jgi:hypothetical protein
MRRQHHEVTRYVRGKQSAERKKTDHVDRAGGGA